MLKHYWEEGQKPERVVVLGKSGFVASAAIEAMVREGLKVTSLGAKDLDLTSEGAGGELGGKLHESDVLLFVSANTPCKDTPTLMLNLKMAEAVHQALQQQPVSHMVYVSSDAVYPGGVNPIDESIPAAPESMHGMMHAAREMMVKQSTEVPVCILRPSLLYGASDPHNGYGPNRFRRLAAQGESIKLFGEGEEMRDHVLIDDVATLIVLCMLHRSEGVLNAVTGRSTSFREIAEKVIALFDVLVEVQGTERQNPITHVHYDNLAVSKVFPGFCFTELQQGLHKTHEAALQSS
jgi:UDP-glucose 4-epimerase